MTAGEIIGVVMLGIVYMGGVGLTHGLMCRWWPLSERDKTNDVDVWYIAIAFCLWTVVLPAIVVHRWMVDD